MNTSHKLSARSLRALLVACACLLVACANARGRSPLSQDSPGQGEVARGVELYRRGEFKEAAEAFRRAAERDGRDADAWQHLGSAYSKLGNEKEARKALEKAISLRFSRIAPDLPSSSREEHDYELASPEERAERRARLVADYARAAEGVEQYLRLSPKNADFWRGQSESLNFYARALAADGQDVVYFRTDLPQKAVILRRSEPRYTEEARRNKIRGAVVLRLVLSAGGTVDHLLALRMLPHGLTEQAMSVARQIKFTPATKDGRPASQMATIEYNFDIY
ncbi:MAG: TonB family protein [Acidobacteria bacterium]|nr:TonB family protein [Acidobacteriota bacterium]